MKRRYWHKVKIFLIVTAGLLLVLVLLYWFSPKPELRSFIPYSTAYFDAEGKLLRLQLSSDEKYRLFAELENISPSLIEATILYEDQDFYQHFGVDWGAIARAFWMTYITSDRRVGASTIVMQLARLRWKIPSHTLSGKISQIVRAIQLSRHYSKRQLLEAYLNLAPYGRNIEGIGAASLIYFDKPASELSLPEALTLAVIPQNPNRRNPTTAQGFERLLTARANLFERWQGKYPAAKAQQKFLDLPMQVRAPEKLPFKAPHFVDYVKQQNSNWQTGKIITSLNSQYQKQLETVIQRYIASRHSLGVKNASALLLNYRSMQIEAMVGSANFHDTKIQGQVNGTTAKRSPGSTLKPFVYALAMDEGLIHPHSLLKDLPTRFAGFSPENYDKKFLGPISASRALIESRNVPAVDLQSKLKKRSFYQLLKDAQVSDLKSAQHYGLALALGGGELTSVELASLYAMLANSGKWHRVSFNKWATPSKGKQLLSAEASYLTLDMLNANKPPNAVTEFLESASVRDIPWKTGTSWAFRDAWAVGISGDHVLVIWVGNFDGRGNNAFVGRQAAGPLFFDAWSVINDDRSWRLKSLYQPHRLNLKRLNVCATTGDLIEKHCPSSVTGWFIPGVSPIKVSNVYRSLPINKNTGLRACWANPQNTEQQVFEVWPSDLKHIFELAGIALRSPPKYETGCELNQTSTSGTAPVITSPTAGVDYVYRTNSEEKNLIPLKAKVDGDVEYLHWFIDSKYIASARLDQSVVWPANPGQYQVKVVDDLARTSVQTVRVVNVSK
jgi:penicillin-binding protein 1C